MPKFLVEADGVVVRRVRGAVALVGTDAVMGDGSRRSGVARIIDAAEPPDYANRKYRHVNGALELNPAYVAPTPEPPTQEEQDQERLGALGEGSGTLTSDEIADALRALARRLA